MSNLYDMLFGIKRERAKKAFFYTDSEGRVRFAGGPGGGGGTASGSGGAGGAASGSTVVESNTVVNDTVVAGLRKASDYHEQASAISDKIIWLGEGNNTPENMERVRQLESIRKMAKAEQAIVADYIDAQARLRGIDGIGMSAVTDNIRQANNMSVYNYLGRIHRGGVFGHDD